MQEKINNFLNGPYFVPVIIILVAIIGFCLGRVSGLQEKREPVRILDLNNSPSNPSLILRERSSDQTNSGEIKGISTDSAEQVVASKNGAKYHYPWCAGAKQISEQNKVTFSSIDEAKKAGYSPATNCKGLR